MASKKFSTQFPGVRYRVHKSRKYSGGNLDRYFFIRYRINGKLKEEGTGWLIKQGSFTFSFYKMKIN
jgi:hypothetical protein